MEAVGFSESAPPLYYALAWVWTQLTGTGEVGLRSLSALAGVATVPVAYLLGAELRGRRAGIVAAALVAVNPMLLWYSQEARGYALLALLTAAAALYFVRALDARRRRTRSDALGRLLGARARDPLLRDLPDRARGRSGCCGAGGGRRWRGSGSSSLAGLALAPLAIHQTSLGHAEWIGGRSLGAPALGDGRDLRRRRDRRHHRPARDRACRPSCRCSPFSPGCCCSPLRGERDERRAGGLMLALAAVTVAGPLALALVAPGQGLRPRPQPAAGAGAAAGRGRDRRDRCAAPAAPAWSSRRSSSPTRSASASGSASRRPGSGPTGRRSRRGWASRRRRGRSSSGLWERRRCATTSRPAPSRRSRPKASPGPCTKSTSSPTARRRRCPRRLLGPGFRQVGYEQVGRLYIRRYALPGPDLAHLRLRRVRDADLNFRSNGVLLDGIGP